METNDINASFLYFLLGSWRGQLLDEIAQSFEFEAPGPAFINSQIAGAANQAEAEMRVIQKLLPSMVTMDRMRLAATAQLPLLHAARKRIKNSVFAFNGEIRRTRMNELVALMRIAKLQDWQDWMSGPPSSLLPDGYLEEVNAWMQQECEGIAVRIEGRTLKMPSCVDGALHPLYEQFLQKLRASNKPMRQWLKEVLRRT